jgi:hypothetical protein
MSDTQAFVVTVGFMVFCFGVFTGFILHDAIKGRQK